MYIFLPGRRASFVGGNCYVISGMDNVRKGDVRNGLPDRTRLGKITW